MCENIYSKTLYFTFSSKDQYIFIILLQTCWIFSPNMNIILININKNPSVSYNLAAIIFIKWIISFKVILNHFIIILYITRSDINKSIWESALRMTSSSFIYFRKLHQFLLYYIQDIIHLSLIHIWRCRRIERCRSRWSPYH